MEQQASVKLSDHVDVESLGGHEEQKYPPSSPSLSSASPSSLADGRTSSFYDLRIAVVGNVDSGQWAESQYHPPCLEHSSRGTFFKCSAH